MHQLKGLCAPALYAGVLWLMAACADAHPFHITTAEMDFNPQTQRYEVSLKVLASDLEEALTRQAPLKGERVGLSRNANLDGQIVAYVKPKFQLIAHVGSQPPGQTSTDNGNSRSQRLPVETGKQPEQGFHWVGKELDKSWVWLYFELETPRAGSRIALMNTIFLELNSGQINICTLRKGATKIALQTDAKRTFVALPPDER